MTKPLSYIELNARCLRENIGTFRKLLPRTTSLIAVVKANAYGHGLKEIMTIADPLVDGFQVDDIEELRVARQYTAKPIYVFGYVTKHDLTEAVALNATLGVYSVEHIQELERIGRTKETNVPLHLKIDALLGRQGILEADIADVARELQQCPHVEVQAVYSHFSNIEDVGNLTHAHAQHEALLRAKEILAANGFSDLPHHISATSGLLVDQAANWGGTFVRLGIGMYGLWPSEHLREAYAHTITLQPVLRWVTHIAQIKLVPAGYPIGYGLTHITTRPTTLAIIPQGYSDGYDRSLSNNAQVLIAGTRCPILGRVAMNMFAVDVSDLAHVALEDEVVMLGTQGNETVSAEDLAERSATITYETVARISPLIPKVVID